MSAEVTWDQMGDTTWDDAGLWDLPTRPIGYLVAESITVTVEMSASLLFSPVFVGSVDITPG